MIIQAKADCKEPTFTNNDNCIPNDINLKNTTETENIYNLKSLANPILDDVISEAEECLDNTNILGNEDKLNCNLPFSSGGTNSFGNCFPRTDCSGTDTWNWYGGYSISSSYVESPYKLIAGPPDPVDVSPWVNLPSSIFNPGGEVRIQIPQYVSVDGYFNRNNIYQSQERWRIQFEDSNGNKISTGLTSDVPDGVRYGWRVGSLGTITLPNGAVRMRFTLSTPGGVQSAVPLEVCFKSLCPDTSSITGSESGCEDEATTFLADPVVPGATYQWSSTGSPDVVGGSETGTWLMYKWSEPGTYNVSMQMSTPNGCVKNYDKAVVIHESPHSGIIGTDSGCKNDEETFEVDGVIPGATYEWLVTGNPIVNGSPTGTSIGYTWANPGTYTVTLETTSADGCIRSHSETIVIKNTFNGYILPSGNYNACVGGMEQFDCHPAPPSGVVLHWSATGNPTLIGNSTDRWVKFVWSNPGTYIVTLEMTTAEGCTTTYTRTVTIHEVTVEINGADEVCHGETTTLSAVGSQNGTYFWSGQDLTSNGQLATVNTSNLAIGTHTYCVTLTGSYGCQGTICKDVEVLANPVVNITGTDVVCQRDIISLSAVSSQSGTYTWSGQNITANGDSATINTDNLTAGIHTFCVTITDSNGCSGSTCTDVEILSIPTANISAPTTILTCDDPSIILDASSSTANGNAMGYLWSGPSGNLGTNPTQLVTEAGTYIISITNKINGCSDTDSIEITNSPTPEVTIFQGGSLFCEGETLDLHADCLDEQGNDDYLWTGIGVTVDNSTDNPLLIPNLPAGIHMYTVIYTDEYGCTATDSTFVAVSPSPDAGTDGSLDICNSELTTISLPSALGGTPHLNGVWADMDNIGVDISNPTNVDFTDVESGVYAFSYTVPGIFPCPDAISEVLVNVFSADAGLNGTLEVCNSGATIISLPSGLGGTPDAGGTWTDTDNSGVNIFDPSSVDFANVASGTYTFTYDIIGVSPCVDASSEVEITVYSVDAGINGSIDVCSSGASTVSLFDGLGGTPDAGGVWVDTDLVGVNISNPASVDFSGIYPGTYFFTYTVEGAGVCHNLSSQVEVNVLATSIVMDAGSDEEIVVGNSVQLNATLGFTSYEWIPNDGISDPSIANPIANPDSTTVYTVIGTMPNGCISTDTVLVTVNHDYCVPEYTNNFPLSHYIAGVEFNEITNMTPLGTDAPPLTDFTDISTDIIMGSTHELIIYSSIFDGYANQINTLVEAWIDFNDNGVFDPSESLGQAVFDVDSFVSFQVTIPMTIAAGTRTMRIRTGHGSYSGPCGLNSCGEAEDYSVNILPVIAATTGIYVDDTATGANDGSSWENAFTDLQDALALGGGNTIHIAEGTYYPTSSGLRGVAFEIPGNTRILGGYVNGGYINGVEVRNPEVYETILSGNVDGVNDYAGNSYHVVMIRFVTDVTLDGVSVKGGNAEDAGSTNTFMRFRGGGIFIKKATVSLNNIEVKWNRAQFGGGLFATELSHVTVTNSIFRNNRADGGSAIYHANRSRMYIDKTRVVDNKSLKRCAIEVNNSYYTRIDNSVIANNASVNASAIGLIATKRNQVCDIYNTTILGENKNRFLITMQVGYGDQLDVSLYNSIVSHQTPAFSKVFKDYNYGALNLNTTNCYIMGSSIMGNSSNNLYSTSDGYLTLDADYSLTSCSPGVNDGENFFASGSTDIDGNPRVINNVDIGAYETGANCRIAIDEDKDEIESISPIVVYPNPTGGRLVIQTDMTNPIFTLLDMTGKEILRTDMEEISLSSLSSGIYILNAMDENGVMQSAKIVKK